MVTMPEIVPPADKAKSMPEVVDGAVTATDRLELQSTAVVNGDIMTKSIVVMEGARINGGVKMTELALVGRPEDSRESKDARAARKM